MQQRPEAKRSPVSFKVYLKNVKYSRAAWQAGTSDYLSTRPNIFKSIVFESSIFVIFDLKIPTPRRSCLLTSSCSYDESLKVDISNCVFGGARKYATASFVSFRFLLLRTTRRKRELWKPLPLRASSFDCRGKALVSWTAGSGGLGRVLSETVLTGLLLIN